MHTIATHHNYEGYRSDEAPDEMVINPQPASAGRQKVIFSSLNRLIAKTKLYLIDQSRLDDRSRQQNNRDSSDHREENPTLRERWLRATRGCSLKGSGYWTHDFTVCKCLQMWDVCVPKTPNSKQCIVDKE